MEPSPHTTPAAPAEGGALVLGGTPIGNLADASPRLREALASADVLAVEDSRTLRKLAAGLGVTTRGRVLVNHDHNEADRAGQIVEAVAAGQTVLLMSDAGMPAVSDPGYVAAAAVADAGLTVTALPGPSAVVTAIAVSGLPSGRFTFEGFLARKGSDRTRRLKALAAEERTMVFYESPHRLAATLHDFAETFGAERRAAVCRELTKLHEEVARGSLAELISWAESKQIKGEIVIVVEGAPAPEAEEAENLTDLVLELVDGGVRLKDACAQVAASYGVSKRDLYEAVLTVRKG
ncbi:16S rRNA (cytidine(1402)-2'-O)-methyltransferase [Rothia nasimurium]|uniref:16S rRNA (cytidine(1402)-2'-O)-methyltransferase n=1 Tax=Rothia nasimurium TaxID=85336 RepID=UPI001F02B934|nr:16S rRNA (cytidine(1402)-2'-O)-methyltransferase [Rothia nasimurium]